MRVELVPIAKPSASSTDGDDVSIARDPATDEVRLHPSTLPGKGERQPELWDMRRFGLALQGEADGARAGWSHWSVVPAIAAAILAMTMIVAVAAGGYRLAFRDRILPGVHVLGVDLGGLRQLEARARLASRLAGLAHDRPVLRLDGVEIALPASAFGEPEALAAGLTQAAARAGRETPFGGLAAVARLASGGTPVQATVVNTQAMREAVAALAPEVDRAPIEPVLVIDHADPGGETVRVQPGQAGRRLDVEQTAAALRAAFASGATGQGRVVDATVVAVPPETDEARLEAARQRVAVALARPLTIFVAGQAFPVERPGRLVERVELTPADLRVVLDGAAFDALAAEIVAATTRAPQNARLEVRGEQVALTPDVPGEAVELEALRNAVRAGLLNGAGRSDVPL
ncbi:MAG: peptidoglycan binding domain-containing protein, partial [Chloroflexota bacterium]